DSVKNLPEEILGSGSAVAPLVQAQACHVTEPVMTSLRGLAVYTVPKVDVLVSAQIRSLNPANIGGVGGGSATNGASLNANVNVPNTVVQQLLGRLPAGALP